MTYLVTNRLLTSLVIDDIGLRLEPSGSKLLSEQTYKTSRLLREYEQKKWVTVAVRSDAPAKAPVPIWPFSAVSAPRVHEPPPVVAPAEATVLQGLVVELKGIISSLQAPLAAAARTPVTITSPTAAAVHPVASIAQPVDEPMFIPRQILPNTADVSINVAKSETEDAGFDAGLEALKKARKK
jgi:capsular polysaccharide biosynthesis protein